MERGGVTGVRDVRAGNRGELVMGIDVSTGREQRRDKEDLPTGYPGAGIGEEYCTSTRDTEENTTDGEIDGRADAANAETGAQISGGAGEDRGMWTDLLGTP